MTVTVTTIVLVLEAVSLALTVMSYTLSWGELSVGTSKLGRCANDRTPVLVSMVKSPASVPAFDQVIFWLSSSSRAA